MRRLLSFRNNETLKPLVRIAVPVMATNMVETLYNLTDTWFLGRLGPAELAAPTISFNLLMLMILLGNGLASRGYHPDSPGGGAGKPGEGGFLSGADDPVSFFSPPS